MTKRVGIYARYSSDNQREASIEDQLRLCEEKAQQQGWQVHKTYTDAAVSGATLLRSGIQSLIQAALDGEFDIVLTEALDRLSRDQEDIAGIYKRMEFAGVKIITLSEGEISTLHIGLKGTMNAIFLKDLADKTRRGMRGRIEQGKALGGVPYGYKVVKRFDEKGEVVKGEREIIPEQAEIIRRIFKEYAYENKSPRTIAAALNKEGVPNPSGKAWAQSTLNGNRKRGVGILNNEIYIGRLIWNRQRIIKNPDTGRNVSRYNDRSQWIIKDVPEHKIVDQELWDAVKTRQKSIDRSGDQLHNKKRAKHLLSGLIKCGQCGGNYSVVNRTHYGCSNAKNKGDTVCTNHRTIRRDRLDDYVLSGLKSRMMRDELLQVFCEEYTKHMNELIKANSSSLGRYQKEQAKLTRERDNIIKAVKDGLPAASFRGELENIELRLEDLDKHIFNARQENKPFLHPCMATHYRQSIENLRGLLNQEGKRAEASQHLRRLIEKIVLSPQGGKKEPRIDLHGDLAGILAIAKESNDMNPKSLAINGAFTPVPANNNRNPLLLDSVGGASLSIAFSCFHTTHDLTLASFCSTPKHFRASHRRLKRNQFRPLMRHQDLGV